MSLHIFGSGRVDTFKKEEQKAVSGLSLSYVASNFFRRGQSIDMSNRRITNLAPPLNNNDVANKKYVDEQLSGGGRKPIITIWAEERGILNRGSYEWSFGDALSNQAKAGYTMLASGRILRMGLVIVNKNDSNPVTSMSVKITINGERHDGILKDNNERSVTKIFDTPVEVAEGDVINFISTDSSRLAAGGIVNLLIELDL